MLLGIAIHTYPEGYDLKWCHGITRVGVLLLYVLIIS